ncbi:unnamed protein product [Rotaria socialis]|uniref:FZ domain-containing protein n=1 Tax=Rotaria socialis TaxID=392032 RepID=A0A819Z0P9_9BILA|nr:unnamed protein product [Rotaria socialis]CAF3342004.1 unnamed protein product [Rotaria socialis]CAF3413919.1 unnamed protein product [Rotaria socialis]CAF4166817.1 unnamed protein product [Rotaria socialis]CAF4205818.1 unnamed protein product [Rotaria socialis]
MTMQTKLCFLLVALLLIVIQSKCADTNDVKASSASGNKNKATEPANDGNQGQLKKSSKGNSRERSRTRNTDDDEGEIIFEEYGPEQYMPPIPVPPMSPSSHGNNPFLNKDPSCFSLVDVQYPLFADMCGALPQIRYSLPNSFGHSERWQIAQVLNTILGSPTATSNNPICNRSLRLLICPLLFPPCPTRHEPKPIIPCQPFCRAVKSQCVAPSLDLLPCDFLPATSELCPVNPSPYNPYLTPYGQQSAGAGAQPTNHAASAAYTAQQSAMAQQLAMAQQSAMALAQSAYPGQNAYGFGMPSPQSQQFMVPSTLPQYPGSSPRAGFGVQYPYNQPMYTPSQAVDTQTPVLIDFPRLYYQQNSARQG